ncbi:MAG: hypothetical protein ACQETH_05100 [Candidatus Rifleibacteriota bacterium]
MKFKWQLFILTLILIICHFIIFEAGNNKVKLKFSPEKINNLLQQQNPAAFWQKIAENNSLKGLEIGYVLNVLEDFQSNFNQKERVSLEAVKAFIFYRQAFYSRAEIALKHVVATTDSLEELRQSMVLLAEIYQRENENYKLEQVRQELEKIDPRFRLQYIDMANTGKTASNSKGFIKLYLIFVWILLILFPTVVMEYERQIWVRKFSEVRDKRGPFLAFNRSNLAGVLLFLSAILFILLGYPENVGLNNRALFLALHIAISWVLCQYPFYKLNKELKPSFSSSFVAFLVDKFRAILFVSHQLLALTLTLVVLHYMVTGLPLWSIKKTLHAILVLPALFSFFLIFLHIILPYIMLARKKAKNGAGLRVFSLKSETFAGWVEYGVFSFLNTLVFLGRLDEKFAAEKIDIIKRRARLKLNAGSGIEEFLLIVNLVLIIQIYFLFDPLRIVRFFTFGPNLAEIVALLLFVFLCSYILSLRKHEVELKADDRILEKIDSEKLIELYNALNRLNYLPENYREGDAAIFAPIALKERKEHIRSFKGEYLHYLHPPEQNLLVSLWRARLAIEWKLGMEEAVFIASLDYQVSEQTPADELRAMAVKHAEIGSESIFYQEQNRLEIIDCAQKKCATITDDRLPSKKICGICSRAMLKSFHQSIYHWTGTENGCCLESTKDKAEN